MEMIVIFNNGRDAAKGGSPRIAPCAIPYPVFDYATKQLSHHESANLSDYAKREWLRGFDAVDPR